MPGGAGRSRLAKSEIVTRAVKVCAGAGDGSAVEASAALQLARRPAQRVADLRVGEPSVPLNDESVPTCQ